MDNFTLMKAAEQAKRYSYSPYSKFKVGAAILTRSGKLYTGTNIENASYTATCCAERVALYKAVSEGERDIIKIAIDGDNEGYTYPCGICRQVLSEFSSDIKIILKNKENKIKEFKLTELFPCSFTFDQEE